MVFFLYILIAILILLLMITIHEFGHYSAAKLLGFGISEFSVGLGPALFRRRKKNGEYFSVRALPLGGYCAFYGEDDVAEAPPEGEKPADIFDETALPTAVKTAEATGEQSAETQRIPFDKQKPWKRIIVMLAGAAFNLFSAFIFSFIYILIVGYSVPVVTQLYADPQTGEIYASQLEKGDKIVAVDGKDVSVLDSFAELVAGASLGQPLTLTVIRDGQRKDVSIVKQKVTVEENGQLVSSEKFGFAQTYEAASVNALEAAGLSFPFTFKLSWAILGAFGQLITGQIPITDMTGPIGTVTTIASYAELDWRYILMFLPLIASNLAIFNILPIPSLDGSRVVFTIIEWIRKKPVNKKVEGTIHAVGLMVLLGFVVIVDVIGFIARL